MGGWTQKGLGMGVDIMFQKYVKSSSKNIMSTSTLKDSYQVQIY